MSDRLRLIGGNQSTQPVANRASTPREYVNRYFPSGSIWAEPETLFKRSKFAQALIDISAVCFAAFFVTLTGVSIAVAFAILLFVRLT